MSKSATKMPSRPKVAESENENSDDQYIKPVQRRSRTTPTFQENIPLPTKKKNKDVMHQLKKMIIRQKRSSIHNDIGPPNPGGAYDPYDVNTKYPPYAGGQNQQEGSIYEELDPFYGRAASSPLPWQDTIAKRRMERLKSIGSPIRYGSDTSSTVRRAESEINRLRSLPVFKQMLNERCKEVEESILEEMKREGDHAIRGKGAPYDEQAGQTGSGIVTPVPQPGEEYLEEENPLIQNAANLTENESPKSPLPVPSDARKLVNLFLQSPKQMKIIVDNIENAVLGSPGSLNPSMQNNDQNNENVASGTASNVEHRENSDNLLKNKPLLSPTKTGGTTQSYDRLFHTPTKQQGLKQDSTSTQTDSQTLPQ